MYFAVEHRRDISLSILYTDACTSPLYIGEISVFRMYFAVVHRPDISLPYIQTHLPRRCTSARYQPSLYSDAPTSPLNIGEISVFLIYRRMYFAVEHRRDIGLSFLYTDACTSPLYIGQISVFRMYFAVVHRPDISLPYIQTHLPRRCTSARYQSSLYTDAPTSPLNICEISVFLICRHMYFAVVHRRDISLPHIQTHLPRRCSTMRYRSSLYIDTCTSPLYIGEVPVFLIYMQTHVPRRWTSARRWSYIR